jgi:hypothetical protein
MTSANIITTDQSSGRVPEAKRSGFYYNWGPQAWFNMIAANKIVVKRLHPTVNYSFLPILRLSGCDTEQLERDYTAIKSRRETVHWYDSPQERWRKRYGNFVRETEWVLLELRKHFSQKQYEEIVVGTTVALFRETSADFIAMMDAAAEKNKQKGKQKTPKASSSKKPGFLIKMMFEHFNPAGWLMGEAKLVEFDLSTGETLMEIPACAWHTCGASDSLPNPNALPEEGCLYVCKAPFEVMFDGKDGGIFFEFEPHLPEKSCTVRSRLSKL